MLAMLLQDESGNGGEGGGAVGTSEQDAEEEYSVATEQDADFAPPQAPSVEDSPVMGGRGKMASRSARLAQDAAEGGGGGQEVTVVISSNAMTDEDLLRLFEAYSTLTSDPASKGLMNVMQFSTIWRLLSGDKRNLFKEMQMFNKFDTDNRGVLSSDNFISGWRTLSTKGFTLTERRVVAMTNKARPKSSSMRNLVKAVINNKVLPIRPLICHSACCSLQSAACWSWLTVLPMADLLS